MSLRNTRKNLGTVIECAENIDESTSTSLPFTNKDKTDIFSVPDGNLLHYEEEKTLLNHFSEENCSYASACSSVGYVSCGEKLATDCSNTQNSQQEEKECVGKWLEESGDIISVIPSSSSTTTATAATTNSTKSPFGFFEKRKRKKSFTGSLHNHQSIDNSSGPFSTSRLNLITFLNNIATPSARSTTRHRNSRSKSSTSRNSAAGPFYSSVDEHCRKNDSKSEHDRGIIAHSGVKGADRLTFVSDASQHHLQQQPLLSSVILSAENDETLGDILRCDSKQLSVDSSSDFPFNCQFHFELCQNSAEVPAAPHQLCADNVTSGADLCVLESSAFGKSAIGSAENSAKVCSSQPAAIFGACSMSNEKGQLDAACRNAVSINCDKISMTSDLTLASVASSASSGFSAGNAIINASNNSISSNSNGTAGSNGKHKARECLICCTRQPVSNFPRLVNCGHYHCCRNCLIKYLRVEIMESRTGITCPECSELVHVNDIYTLLEKHSFLADRYECFSLRKVLSSDPDTRWCPAPDCMYAVIAYGCAACPQLECERPGCGTMFCYHCKSYWHPNQTCDQAREKRLKPSADMDPSTSKKGASSGERLDENVRNTDTVKACPRCGALIVKMNDGSCNHMTCTLCGVEFCWLCLKQINELHYISPTGCTFWGKKPWTRKKKLLWQIGTLIGAPLGIALIAGLAVPGIICGVPIFAGRKTYQHFSNLSRTKRHLLTVVSVSGSLLVSPVLAIMAVGVGVPIMLAYVYGVVPLSLCRNGGCGSGSGETPDVSDAAYSAEDSEDNTLFSEGQERSRLLRALREEAAVNGSGNTASTKTNLRKSRKKQCLEVALSDQSNASSPSGIGTSRYANNDSRFRINKSGSTGDNSFLYMRDGGNMGGDESISNNSGAGVGACLSFGVSTASSEHHRRQRSNESGITSLGEKINTEDASVKAIAGSQYNYDDKSVHTIWSNGGGVSGTNIGGVPFQADISSYNEDNASTKACGGSVLDARSLIESASSALPHLSVLSRERDISPTPYCRPQSKNSTNSARGKSVGSNSVIVQDLSTRNCSLSNKTAGSASPPLLSAKSTRKKSLCSKSFDELSNHNSSTKQLQYNTANNRSASGCSTKKSSIGTLSRKSFYPICSSSAASSTCSNFSNLNVALVTTDLVNYSSNDDSAQSGSSNTKNIAKESQRSQISLRKLIRRPIDLFMGRSSTTSISNESRKKLHHNSSHTVKSADNF